MIYASEYKNCKLDRSKMSSAFTASQATTELKSFCYRDLMKEVCTRPYFHRLLIKVISPTTSARTSAEVIGIGEELGIETTSSLIGAEIAIGD